jgi:hypothetical protein
MKSYTDTASRSISGLNGIIWFLTHISGPTLKIIGQLHAIFVTASRAIIYLTIWMNAGYGSKSVANVSDMAFLVLQSNIVANLQKDSVCASYAGNYLSPGDQEENKDFAALCVAVHLMERFLRKSA